MAITDTIASDKLDQLREAVRSYRTLLNALANLEEDVRAVKMRIDEMQSKILPDLFHQANVDRVGLPKEGNHPAFDAVLQPYYHARIPKENQEEAFTWLEDHGHGDLIKTTMKVELGRGERELAKKVQEALKKMGVDYSQDLGVPWNTLTVWIREQIEKHQSPPLALFGAIVGTIVKLKERKDG